MADLIALVTLGLQYALLVFAANLWLGSTLPFSGIGVTFAVLAVIGMLLWHRKELSPTVKKWGTLAVRSVVLGIAFFVVDLLIALLSGQANPLHFPGGLLGLPLTLLICPGGTIICVAGLVRASYTNRKAGGHPPTEQSARP
jgi:hypothetical protein